MKGLQHRTNIIQHPICPFLFFHISYLQLPQPHPIFVQLLSLRQKVCPISTLRGPLWNFWYESMREKKDVDKEILWMNEKKESIKSWWSNNGYFIIIRITNYISDSDDNKVKDVIVIKFIKCNNEPDRIFLFILLRMPR